MSDWPAVVFGPPVVSTADARSGQLGGFLMARFTSTAAAWPSANRALFMPVEVQSTCTAYQMCFEVGTQSGNLDVGIYDEQAKRLVSSGSTAVAAAGVQVVDITNTVLTPGVYFLAMSVDNTTATFRKAAIAPPQVQALGVQQQGLASVTLPDPATFANPLGTYVPLVSASVMQAVI